MKKISAFVVASALAVQNLSTMNIAFAENESVYINEVCTQNKTVISDSYGNYSDWIELYNDGESEADISGWGLSDKSAKPLKWTFPDNTVIPAKSYLVVFASGMESTAGEIHTSFSLSKDGEEIVLSKPDGMIVQTIEVEPLAEDQTYGRVSADSEEYEKMSATPGTKNEEVVVKPVFSAESGFYSNNFDLTISAQNDTVIYYTTDGSDPTNSPTAKIYDGAFEIRDRTSEPNIYSTFEGLTNESDKTVKENQRADMVTRSYYKKPLQNVNKATVVLATAKNKDGKFSSIESATYFVTNGGLAEYEGQTVVSLVTNPENLFNPDYGIYVTGTQYLDWVNNGGDLKKSEWDADNICNFFSRGKEWERGASITIFENGENVVEQDMGIRIKGSSTRNTPQKSFNLYARTDYEKSKIEYPLLPDNYRYDGKLIDKYDSITLRSVSDANRLRDGFSQGLLSERESLTTQNMKPCTLFINGEYWGSYMMIEKISEYFIQSNYGVPSENVALLNPDGPEGDTPDEEYEDFVNFCKYYSYMDLSDPKYYSNVCKLLDIDSIIEHYASGIYLGTYDWPNWNYGIWRNTGDVIEGNPYSDRKWRFITFDMDYSSGVTYDSSAFREGEGYKYDNFKHFSNSKNGHPTNLFVSLLKNEEFRNKFVSVYCDYANDVCSAEKGIARAEYYSENYTDFVAESIIRWWGFWGGNIENEKSNFRNKTINSLKTFFSKRADYTLEHMKQYLGLEGSLKNVTIAANGGGKIQINSIIPDLSNGTWTGQYFSNIPVTLTAIPDDNSEFTGWSGDLSGTESSITVTLKDAMNITADFGEKKVIRGDANADGEFNIADAVVLQKWLLCMPDSKLNNWSSCDLNNDGEISVYDFVIMRSELIRK